MNAFTMYKTHLAHFRKLLNHVVKKLQTSEREKNRFNDTLFPLSLEKTLFEAPLSNKPKIMILR